MRRPNIGDFDNGDGTTDYEEFDEKMSDFEDSERDRELEEHFERTEERERQADYTDQD